MIHTFLEIYINTHSTLLQGYMKGEEKESMGPHKIISNTETKDVPEFSVLKHSLESFGRFVLCSQHKHDINLMTVI
jgi:hypothetical protein